VSLDDGVGSALDGIGSRLRGIAACTLGLMLALCLAGLTGMLTFDTAAAALGFVAGGGLIRSRAVALVCMASRCEPIVEMRQIANREVLPSWGGGSREAARINAWE
jgi:hypothetical protein